MFEKYLKIKYPGDEDNKGIFDEPEDEIIVEEKMDGGNFRFALINGQLVFGSRNLEIVEGSKQMDFFKRCYEFVKDKVGNIHLSNMIFYGEAMMQHSFQYDWDKIPPYLGFDIKDLKDGKYLDYDYKVNLFSLFCLPVVPLVKRCKVKDLGKIDESLIPLSAYPNRVHKEHQRAEGVVIKNYSKQLFAKIVQERFKEINKETFGKSKKQARQEGDEELFIATYCTNARIDKNLFKLLDEGHKLSMELMHHLPRRVMEDIYEENWKDIVWSNWKLDFSSLRRKVPKRCLAVLQQILVNNSLQTRE